MTTNNTTTIVELTDTYLVAVELHLLAAACSYERDASELRKRGADFGDVERREALATKYDAKAADAQRLAEQISAAQG